MILKHSKGYITSAQIVVAISIRVFLPRFISQDFSVHATDNQE